MNNDNLLSPSWIISIYGIAATLSGAAAIRGLVIHNDQWVLAGLICLVMTIVILPLAMKTTQAVTSTDPHHDSERIRNQLRILNDSIERLNESQVLSDDARRVLNRRKERELLCKAIEEDIRLEDWNAGLVLVRELAERFGYRVEAEEFRAKIESARSKTVHRDVTEAVQGLNDLIASHRWDQAMTEAARITRMYHDSPQTDGLRHRVEQAKERYKIDIERSFLLAAQEDRIEQAMDLLKEMDHYLSEEEAEPFREVARGVIGKARENLGVQFKLAVNDRAWKRAEEVGEQIIAEFPNSRMAQEVRDMLDEIRRQASHMQRS